MKRFFLILICLFSFAIHAEDSNFRLCDDDSRMLAEYIENVKTNGLIKVEDGDLILFAYDLQAEILDYKKQNDARWFKRKCDPVALDVLLKKVDELISISRSIEEIAYSGTLAFENLPTDWQASADQLSGVIESLARENRKVFKLSSELYKILIKISKLMILYPEIKRFLPVTCYEKYLKINLFFTEQNNRFLKIADRFELKRRLLEYFVSKQPWETVVYEEFHELAGESRINCILPMASIEDSVADEIIDQIPGANRILERIQNPYVSKTPCYLIVGQHGCGKSLFARALAKKSGLEPIWISAPLIGTSYQNDGAQRIGFIFRMIEALLAKDPNRCFIIIIDEVETAKGQESGFSKDSDRSGTLMALSQEIDRLEKNKNIVILATTCNTKGMPVDFRNRFCPFHISEPNPAALKRILINLILNAEDIIIDQSLNDVAINQIISKVKALNIRAINIIMGEAIDGFCASVEKDESCKLLTKDAIEKAIDWYKNSYEAMAKDDQYSWESYFVSHPQVLPVAGAVISVASFVVTVYSLMRATAHA